VLVLFCIADTEDMDGVYFDRFINIYSLVSVTTVTREIIVIRILEVCIRPLYQGFESL